MYLGHVIDEHGLRPTQDKVQAVLAAPEPKNVTELKAYLGLLNYYGRFLPNLSSTLAPLYQLLNKNTHWHWSNKERQAFQASKKLLTVAPVLVHFDPSKDVILSCDASAYGIGAVLAHKFSDGSEKPIAYASRTLSPAEKGYSQLEKEGLACVYGVKKFHEYLFGRMFFLYTDHKPLLGLLDEQKIPAQASARIAALTSPASRTPTPGYSAGRYFSRCGTTFSSSSHLQERQRRCFEPTSIMRTSSAGRGVGG